MALKCLTPYWQPLQRASLGGRLQKTCYLFHDNLLSSCCQHVTRTYSDIIDSHWHFFSFQSLCSKKTIMCARVSIAWWSASNLASFLCDRQLRQTADVHARKTLSAWLRQEEAEHTHMHTHKHAHTSMHATTQASQLAAVTMPQSHRLCAIYVKNLEAQSL